MPNLRCQQDWEKRLKAKGWITELDYLLIFLGQLAALSGCTVYSSNRLLTNT